MVALGGVFFLTREVTLSRGTSPIRKRTPLGPDRRFMPRAVGGSERGVGVFLWARYPRICETSGGAGGGLCHSLGGGAAGCNEGVSVRPYRGTSLRRNSPPPRGPPYDPR